MGQLLVLGTWGGLCVCVCVCVCKDRMNMGGEECVQEENTIKKPPGTVTPMGIRTDRGNGLLSSQSLQKDINVRDRPKSSR